MSSGLRAVEVVEGHDRVLQVGCDRDAQEGTTKGTGGKLASTDGGMHRLHRML
jgi:hypothetical protein